MPRSHDPQPKFPGELVYVPRGPALARGQSTRFVTLGDWANHQLAKLHHRESLLLLLHPLTLLLSYVIPRFSLLASQTPASWQKYPLYPTHITSKLQGVKLTARCWVLAFNFFSKFRFVFYGLSVPVFRAVWTLFGLFL